MLHMKRRLLVLTLLGLSATAAQAASITTVVSANGNGGNYGGSLSVLNDGIFPTEGSQWNLAEKVSWNGKGNRFVFAFGDLYRIDPYTGDTLGKEDWRGDFPRDLGVSAHPKVDEATGELLFFNYGKTAPYLHYGVVDGDNHLVHYVDVELPARLSPLARPLAVWNRCQCTGSKADTPHVH